MLGLAGIYVALVVSVSTNELLKVGVFLLKLVVN